MARHHPSWPRIPGRAPTDPTRRLARPRGEHPSRPRSGSPRRGCCRGRDASGRAAIGRVRRSPPRPFVRASRSVWRALRGRSRSVVLLWSRRRRLGLHVPPARPVPSQADRQSGRHRPRPGTAGPTRVCRGSCATGTSICRPARRCRRPPDTGWHRCLCRGPKQPPRIGPPSPIDVDRRGPRPSAQLMHREPACGSGRGSVSARPGYHAASIRQEKSALSSPRLRHGHRDRWDAVRPGSCPRGMGSLRGCLRSADRPGSPRSGAGQPRRPWPPRRPTRPRWTSFAARPDAMRR